MRSVILLFFCVLLVGCGTCPTGFSKDNNECWDCEEKCCIKCGDFYWCDTGDYKEREYFVSAYCK